MRSIIVAGVISIAGWQLGLFRTSVAAQGTATASTVAAVAGNRVITAAECTAERIGTSVMPSAIGEPVRGVTLKAPSWIDAAALPKIRRLIVAAGEEHGANALVVNEVVHLSARWPRTREMVEQAGFRVTSLDISEFEKAEGALTCSSLIFST